MALGSAITGLSPRGTPGPALFGSTSTPSPFVRAITQLRPGGISGRRYGDFTTEVSTLVDITASDTASLSATESPVDAQEIATTDTARLSATETAQLFNHITVVDTARLSVSETINLGIVGVTEKIASDTASLSASEALTISVTIEVTDIASLSASESATVDVNTEQVSVTDTASLSASEAVLLNVFSGVNDIAVGDVAFLRTTEIAIATEYVPVRPIRRIALSISMPHIELEIL